MAWQSSRTAHQLLTGAVIGLVIGRFRAALDHMNTARTDTIARADQRPVPGFVLGLCRGRRNHRVCGLAGAAFAGNLRLAAAFPTSRR